MSLTPAAAAPCPRETMTTSNVDYIIQHYVFPCQLTVFTFVAYKTIQKIANEQTRVVVSSLLFINCLSFFYFSCLVSSLNVRLSFSNGHFFLNRFLKRCQKLVHI